MNKNDVNGSIGLEICNVYEGETLEQKINRIVNNKETMTAELQLIYTDRKHGVLPEYNIRTDRFEVAIDAMDKVQKTKIAQREEYLNPKDVEVDSNPEEKGE